MDKIIYVVGGITVALLIFQIGLIRNLRKARLKNKQKRTDDLASEINGIINLIMIIIPITFALSVVVIALHYIIR